MQTALHSLILLLDQQAVPFCNYVAQPPSAVQHRRGACATTAEPARMPLETLERALAFAREKHLALLCVLSKAPLPAAHLAALERAAHQKIVPFALHARMPEAIPVIQPRDVAGLVRRKWRGENAILRVPRRDLPKLAKTFARLKGRLKRLNVRLLDLDAYTESDFQEYRRQCADMARIIAALKWPKEGTECNLLTDRLALQAMHNCGAGVTHVTVAPNGRFYLCPGFYYQNETDAIGNLQEGLQVKNARLLTVDGAPVCRTCDAYHCLRCLWLNKRVTAEINTPSRQQCVTAHLEREAAGRLRESLVSAQARNLGQLSPVTPLDYLDPFEKVTRKRVPLAAPFAASARGALAANGAASGTLRTLSPKVRGAPTQQPVS